jgi:hypothetical protein
MHHTTVGAALLLMALPLSALAQPAAPPPATPSPALKEAPMKMRAACAGDMQKFCADVARGNGARQGCMRGHRAELSPACQAARSELRAIRRQERGWLRSSVWRTGNRHAGLPRRVSGWSAQAR